MALKRMQITLCPYRGSFGRIATKFENEDGALLETSRLVRRYTI